MITKTDKIHLVIKAQAGLAFENWFDEEVGVRQAKFTRRYFSRYAASVNCYLVHLGNNVYEIQPKVGA